MRLGDGVEWALHSCTVLALLPPGSTLTAARLAEFHGVPPAYLAKHLQSLSNAGIVESVPGRTGGYRLAQAADDITLLAVVEALEGRAPAFTCSEIRQRGPAAGPASSYRSVCAIARAMGQAEVKWRDELRSQSVGDIVRSLGVQVSPAVAVKAAAWFQEVVR